MTKHLIILATTYPRWKDDSKSPFVKIYAGLISQNFDSTTVIVPHYRGAAKIEREGALRVKRFRYFWPASKQNIVYEEHASKSVKPNVIYGAKLLFFVLAQITTTVITTRKNTIINAHWIIPQGLAAIIAAKLWRGYSVVTVHGGDVFTLNSKPIRKIKRFILKHADEVIVNSSITKEFAELIYRDRVYHIIPMGTDTDLFKPNNKRKLNKRLEAVFVGRLSREKGAMYICEAIHKLEKRKKRNEVRLSIIGDGEEKLKIEKYIKQHKLQNKIRLLGWLPHDKVRKYLGEADVFVGPSIIDNSGWREAFGLVFAEAMASGLPVITTKTGGMVDLVVENENGFFVPQKDSDAIADALEKLSTQRELLKQMSKNSRKKIINKFSWPVVIEKYQKIFNNL